MSFQICSDLHLNYWWGPTGLNNIQEVTEWIRQVLHPDINSPNNSSKRFIILAGDVAPIEWEPLYLFLEGLIRCGYTRIIWVPGNHEFLSPKTSRKTISQLEEMAINRVNRLNQQYLNVGVIHWVNRSILQYQDLRIIGCTLWSIPNLTEPKVLNHHMFIAGEDPAGRFILPPVLSTNSTPLTNVTSSTLPAPSIVPINSSNQSSSTNPINPVKYDSAIYTNDNLPLTPQSYTQLAIQDREWLFSTIHQSNKTSDCIIVVTHYPPSKWMENPSNFNDGKISMYTNDLPLSFFPKEISMWISGHSHFTTRKFADVDKHRILFLSNPIGYPREHKDKSREYHPEWILDMS